MRRDDEGDLIEQSSEAIEVLKALTARLERYVDSLEEVVSTEGGVNNGTE